MVAQSAVDEREQLFFDFLADLPVVVQRHEGQLSSDAGLLPIGQFDQRWNFTARMAACLHDPKPARGQSLISMLRQRVYGILAGYEDCNDHDTLRDDPVFKLVAGRRPEDDALASQPTLSRFENLATPAVLQKLIDFNIQTGIERLKQKHGGQLPASITLDLDATDDPTHGHQQLTLFHGYFGQYQYFPLIISEATTRHVFLAWLRPGTVHASLGADDDLMRVVSALRKERPDIQIHVRADAGFGLPRMYQICEQNRLTYTLGFATNPRLKKLTGDLMKRAVELHEQTGKKARLFQCFQYQCNTWDHPRAVIAKAECHAGGTNLRFVSTNLPALPSPADWPTDPVAREVYDDYTLRGESEQRMDELKNGLHMDRLSCHRFKANFFRLMLHTAAFNLLNAMRDDAQLPELLVAGQPCTWRTCLIKVAAQVVQTTRRVVVRLAAQWPWWPLYRAASRRALAFQSSA
ncbi:MAG TPA: IS1380 family transposase [Terriglobales bacterium]|nr:IS1380 family transposase [Terriglobales bacterium]